VSIVAFKKGQMEVKAHAWDRNLGGRDLDNVLTAHFAAEFKAKTGLDIYTNAKARYRMKVQVEKCRQTLTINPQVPINVECLMEDNDFRCAQLDPTGAITCVQLHLGLCCAVARGCQHCCAQPGR
jgi:heat shock 70kDa protein 4